MNLKKFFAAPVFVVVGFAVFAGCVAVSPISSTTDQTVFHTQSSTPIDIEQIPTFENTFTPVFRATSTITNTVAPSKFDAELLRKWQSDNGERYIVVAFWSQDGSKIYYALDTGETAKPRSPDWFAIDLRSREDVKMTSPPPIFQPSGFLLDTVYPQFEGFVSPSGRYRLDVETNITGLYLPENPKSILWLIDTLGEQEPIEVIESDVQILQNVAYWLPGERKVILDVTIGETGSDQYLVDVDTGSVTSLLELINRNIDVMEWALSPDGKKIAMVYDFRGFQILSLEGETLASFRGYFFRLRWSPDSRLVYYYHGPKWPEEEIGVYDLNSGKSQTLFSLAELEAKGVHGGFNFSPQGDQVIFWNRSEIWLVTHFAVVSP